MHDPRPSTPFRAAARPGGRSRRVREAVLQAALALLTERGYDAIELPEIARRAGVHPATVYRRWGGKSRVVGEAMLEHATAPLSPTPDTGALRSDLERLLVEGGALLRTPAVRALFELLTADGIRPTPETARARDRFWEMHRVEVTNIVDRAVARGELPAGTDPEALIELVIGPALVRLVMRGLPIDAAFARSAAARVAAAFEGGS